MGMLAISYELLSTGNTDEEEEAAAELEMEGAEEASSRLDWKLRKNPSLNSLKLEHHLIGGAGTIALNQSLTTPSPQAPAGGQKNMSNLMCGSNPVSLGFVYAREAFPKSPHAKEVK